MSYFYWYCGFDIWKTGFFVWYNKNMIIKYENIKVVAGIVLYNSDPVRVCESVSTVYNQVDKLLFIDNGSENLEEIKKCLNEYKDITYIENSKNLGIAAALKQLMDYAIKYKFDWVLSLDDDSVIDKDLISVYKKFLNVPDVGAMSCKIEDRNYEFIEDNIYGEYEEVPHCISSSCFMNVDAYKKTEGYDVSMFIDRVDDDICYKLSEAGYKIIKIDYIGMLHEMGKGVPRKFLWHTSLAPNYSPMRRYYIFRNEVIVRSRHDHSSPKEWPERKRPMIINFIFSSAKILMYEDQKLDKIKASFFGWRDGTRNVKQNRK